MSRSAAALALALQCVASLGFPLAERWHEHAPDEHAQWHAENDDCERTVAPYDCALLRATRAPAKSAPRVEGLRSGQVGVLAAPEAVGSPTAGRTVGPSRARGPPAV